MRLLLTRSVRVDTWARNVAVICLPGAAVLLPASSVATAEIVSVPSRTPLRSTGKKVQLTDVALGSVGAATAALSTRVGPPADDLIATCTAAVSGADVPVIVTAFTLLGVIVVGAMVRAVTAGAVLSIVNVASTGQVVESPSAPPLVSQL